MKHSFESTGSSSERSEQGEHKRKLILTKLGGDALNAANATVAQEQTPAVEQTLSANPFDIDSTTTTTPVTEIPSAASLYDGDPFDVNGTTITTPAAEIPSAASLYDDPFNVDAAPTSITAEDKQRARAELLDGFETRPQPSEAERRLQSDREGVDAALRMYGSAAHENLSPDDRLEVELSLDIFDEISEQLDDEENDKNAHDILEKMVQKYDRLARKAPTPDRRQKYFIMAQIANKQKNQFGDWKAIDAAKNRPKSAAQKALEELIV